LELIEILVATDVWRQQMIRTIMIATVALMLSAGPAEANFLTGSQLLAKCRAHKTLVAAGEKTTDGQAAANAMYCRGYVWGYADGLRRPHGELGKPCWPDGVTYIQILAVVIKYLEENPAQLHRPSGDLVETALQEAWPCN
jgi:hypothetical protein